MMRAVFAVVVFLVLEIAWYTQYRAEERLTWLPILAPIVLLSPVFRALRRQFTKTTVTGDRLRFETGAFSKTTRTIQLSKLQDVRVDQHFGQRIFGVGNLSLETSGETSRLVLEDVDSPQAMAEDLLNRSQQAQQPHH
ncbi:MAG: PH domain-containing protein [Candidatus Solibacter sp.]